jgi:hypothetical protein
MQCNILRLGSIQKAKNRHHQIFNGISPTMLYHLMQSRIARSVITNFCNQCILNCSFPNEMKISKIVPVSKLNMLPHNLNSGQFPSSLTTKCFSKTAYIHTHTSNYLEETNLLSPQQFGFRKHHSVHVSTVLSDLLYLNRDKNLM